MDGLRDFMQPRSGASRAARMASTGRPVAARSAVRWVTWSHRPPRKAGHLVKAGAEAPPPFHGYYFKVLTAQGPAAAGGAKNYVADGAMSGGFALVAWPAQYNVTGIMTFIVNQDGVVHQSDLGADTPTTAKAMTLYNPDPSWAVVQ